MYGEKSLITDESSDSQGMVHAPSAWVSRENLLEMQILRPNTGSTKSESLRVCDPGINVLNSPLGDSDA